MIFLGGPRNDDPLRDAMRRATLADETTTVAALMEAVAWSPEIREQVCGQAVRLMTAVRARKPQGLEAFLQEYSLSSQEGVVLMCLAEALLRIPDDATRDRLIRDKVGSAEWANHLRHSESFLVNASTWALMLTGRLMPSDQERAGDVSGLWHRLVARSGEAVVRRAIIQAMGILGRQFVMGETIGIALERAHDDALKGYRHSFDMLGEAARTAAAAERYLDAYSNTITYIGCMSGGRGPEAGPGLSVKLSALHPRYEYGQRQRVIAEMVPRLLRLVEEAAIRDIGLCVDAEETERLDLSLDVISAVLDRMPRGWDGFGLAVQAYQKRAPLVIDWLVETARSRRRRLQIRLVKGAYWDSEVKRAQERGLAGYPVFTRKAATDLSYLACARRLAAARDVVYPQFATHNAHSIAAVRQIMGAEARDFEFQRLHGMGVVLHDQLVADGVASRIYGPIGSHQDLLPYLVRRLLENGANSSFVNRLADVKTPVEELAADPVEILRELPTIPHPRIPLPVDLYRPERENARGVDLSDPLALNELARAMDGALEEPWSAEPLIGGQRQVGVQRPLFDPADETRQVGIVGDSTPEQVDMAVGVAAEAAAAWDRVPAETRALLLERAADLYQENGPELMARCVREAGKTIPDALAELRESVDFLRYYAARAREDFGPGTVLPGPTGESNRLELHGRGVFACISPWNFPLSIFTGQVAAALAAGNTVVAKPAEQTPLVAAAAAELLHRAGIDGSVFSLLPGDGQTGARLIADRRIMGVAFTGSNNTAWAIQRSLADRRGPIIPLIAETGGLNAMIVDSSALPEQVVADALLSAFSSAGQRCSALRLLFLQNEIAPRVIEMLEGAMRELVIGDPGLLSTDVGPVIDRSAVAALETHRAVMEKAGRTLFACSLPENLSRGNFYAPHLIEIDHPSRLEGEVFGPFLHVVRFAAGGLADVLGWVRESGYGLTLGIHSRVETTVRAIVESARVGNVYVNRSMIGAVVGSQPFGGEGLSGTGPKSGGPRTLHRFATERAISVNTVAAGGNATLLSLDGYADGKRDLR
ncbi:bifunctional proline dehydrogenase/L-glutamate gamma-semialdehyde dehydrogenase PutA [Telmatospirillum sp.]|uniref:bifunctional proline dehydrogenase/L-glutamate gamma-semialdehyde dehydrogenase PutA n=1 Tax=Telmatospirillum sp. TaxID=2079197 RepID=UPI00284CEFFD|nr:bifunctional proline dehydrogenase/L-glutamate gamma-semialdehyde dehydrogenase PutA [Telmatospirillum sp.]MDR3435700.1 bifunctional proline dehydrogenase/L-glutamate gamma-semialdehyde dehydrogenase PutA [Telmatospirillum sp.]